MPRHTRDSLAIQVKETENAFNMAASAMFNAYSDAKKIRESKKEGGQKISKEDASRYHDIVAMMNKLEQLEGQNKLDFSEKAALGLFRATKEFIGISMSIQQAAEESENFQKVQKVAQKVLNFASSFAAEFSKMGPIMSDNTKAEIKAFFNDTWKKLTEAVASFKTWCKETFKIEPKITVPTISERQARTEAHTAAAPEEGGSKKHTALGAVKSGVKDLQRAALDAGHEVMKSGKKQFDALEKNAAELERQAEKTLKDFAKKPKGGKH